LAAASLLGANLARANLTSRGLSIHSLRRINLRDAVHASANLSGAASMVRADLAVAVLSGAQLPKQGCGGSVLESSKRAWASLCVVLCVGSFGCGDDAASSGTAARAPCADAANLGPDAGTNKVYSGRFDADAGNDGKAPWLIQSGDSVFFVGNSFFDWQGRVLPDWVAALGQSANPTITIKTGSHIVPGVKPLAWFYDQQASKDAIASKQYTLFVLQGEDTEPVDDKEGFQNAVRDYYHAITKRGGRVMLFMTWDFVWNKDNPDFFRKLSAAYEEIGAELDIPVIPVGLIWEDCNKAPFPGEQPYFLNGQDLHETEKGSAANAYATFAMLTGVNPMGVEFKANGNTSSPELLKYLSDKAWFRVASRLHD
jgi:hypothetical protein